MSNRIELEESYILNDNYDIYKLIKKNKFEFKERIIEEDTYFTDKEEKFIKDKICLRTRKTNEELLELTYKPKTDDNTKKYGKREVNIFINIEDYDDIKYVIKQLGYLEYVSFRKERETFTKIIDTIEYNIMIDKIEKVGSFVEFEILTDINKDKEKLKSKLDEFIAKFKCDKLKEKILPYRDIVKKLEK